MFKGLKVNVNGYCRSHSTPSMPQVDSQANADTPSSSSTITFYQHGTQGHTGVQANKMDVHVAYNSLSHIAMR